MKVTVYDKLALMEFLYLVRNEPRAIFKACSELISDKSYIMKILIFLVLQLNARRFQGQPVPGPQPTAHGPPRRFMDQ